MAERKDKQQDLDNRAALTGHTTVPHVTEDPQTGKVQSIHTTRVVTDPDSDEAVQGHDDPRVNGGDADPLRRAPSPNDIADGAEVDEAAAAEHVTVSSKSDEDVAAGRLTDEDVDAAADEND